MATLAKEPATPVPKPARKRHYIKEWRLYRDLTQERLAERVGLSASSISQLETYSQGYSDDTLIAIAHALDCTPGDLLANDPNAPDYQLWLKLKDYSPSKLKMALKIIDAIDDEAA